MKVKRGARIEAVENSPYAPLGRTPQTIALLCDGFRGLRSYSIKTMVSPLPEDAVILLAEDLANDVFLVRRAMANAGIQNPFFVVNNGEECLAYMHGVGKYANRDESPLPDILLLDLKMPKLDGFEVLRALRGDRRFAALRIIVLTSSEDIYDVNKAYELGANSFLVKPHEFENFIAMMRALSAFWLQSNKAPKIESAPPKSNQENGGKNGHHHANGR